MMPYLSPVTAADFDTDTQTFFTGKRVVVTGGGGFIGSHVVEQVVALGGNAVVLSRRGFPDFLRPFEGRIESVECDLTDRSQARTALAAADIVLHLAADIGGLTYNMAHPASIFDNNMRIGMNVLDGARENAVGRVLLCSSACVYPRFCSVPTPEDEGFKDTPEPTNSGYGWAKRMLEFLGAQYEQEFGLSVAIARPYNAYGPRDEFDPERSHVIPALIRKALESGGGDFPVWGDGEASRAFIYVDDFARGIIEVAARHPGADPMNIGADEEVTIKVLAEMIAELTFVLTGKRPTPIFDPAAPTGQPRRNCDTTKARAVLGFSTRDPLNEGLRKTIEWYLSQ